MRWPAVGTLRSSDSSGNPDPQARHDPDLVRDGFRVSGPRDSAGNPDPQARRDPDLVRDGFRVSGPRDSEAYAGTHHVPNVNRDPDADSYDAPHTHCHPDSDA